MTYKPLGRLFVYALAAALGMSMYGCSVSTSPVTGKKRAYAYTWQQELQIGKEADQQIIAQYGIYDDPELAQYVERLGQRLLETSHLRRPDAEPIYRQTEFTFRVLDSPVVNAFALPGGYVYVTRGLLAHVQNEAQLAVVLGHEIGHVAARHASQRALSGQLAQIGLIAGAVGGELLGYDGRSILQGGGLAAQLLLLRYGRDDERESDELGVEYSAKAGYDAAEGGAFFTSLKRISERAGASIPGFMSTHPDPGEREERIPELAVQWASEYQMNEVGQGAFFSEIDGMVFGDNPRQGFVENGLFYHPELRFSFPVPSDWRTQNQPSQVALFPEDQKAAILFTIEGEASSAADAAREFSGSDGLTITASTASQVSGLPAHVVEGNASDQSNNQIRFLATFIEHGGNVYRFIGLSAAGSFSSYRRLFDNTMRGFRNLSDPRILATQPARIDVETAGRSGAFSSFLPGTLPSQLTADDLAIANQLRLDSQILTGSQLKLITTR